MPSVWRRSLLIILLLQQIFRIVLICVLVVNYIYCKKLDCLSAKISYNIAMFFDSTVNLEGYVIVIFQMRAFKKMLSMFTVADKISEKSLATLKKTE